MGLILLPLTRVLSQITPCFSPPPTHLFPSPASSSSPLLASETLSLPLPAILSSLLPSMMVSLSNQTAGLLSAWWLYGWGLSLPVSLPHISHSPLSSLFPSLPPCLSFHCFCHHSIPLPPSVTTALEEMSFHGRFAAISKMAALPNGQLPWF